MPRNERPYYVGPVGSLLTGPYYGDEEVGEMEIEYAKECGDDQVLTLGAWELPAYEAEIGEAMRGLPKKEWKENTQEKQNG